MVNLLINILTMATLMVTIAAMNIPSWLGGIYRKGKEEGRWTSYEDMAHAYGFKTATLFRWIKGNRQPEPVHCIQLSRAFGVPLAEVLEMAGHGEDVRAMLLST